MQFTVTFLGLVLLLSGASARPSIRESCGADAQVTDKKTLVTSSGTELTFTTTSCPGFAALRNVTTAPSTVHKRQSTSQSRCDFTCNQVACNTTVAQPAIADCGGLTIALVELNQTFACPATSFVQVKSGTCIYTYANFDNITYNVCAGGFGVLAEIAAADCFTTISPQGTLTAGSCISPQVHGDDWIVQSGHS